MSYKIRHQPLAEANGICRVFEHARTRLRFDAPKRLETFGSVLVSPYATCPNCFVFGYNFGGKEGRVDESSNGKDFAELIRPESFDTNFFRRG